MQNIFEGVQFLNEFSIKDLFKRKKRIKKINIPSSHLQ